MALRQLRTAPPTSTNASKTTCPRGGVAKLLNAAKAGRHGVRDTLLLLMIYRPELRVSEAIGLRRDELDLDCARSWVRRLKGGLSVEQPIAGDELRSIKRYLAACTDALPWLFISKRSQPVTRQAVNCLIGAAAERAGLPGVHPHTLRHSCGFVLADKGHARPAIDPGLPEPSRSPAHRPLHPHCRLALRRAVAVIAEVAPSTERMPFDIYTFRSSAFACNCTSVVCIGGTEAT